MEKWSEEQLCMNQKGKLKHAHRWARPWGKRCGWITRGNWTIHLTKQTLDEQNFNFAFFLEIDLSVKSFNTDWLSCQLLWTEWVLLYIITMSKKFFIRQHKGLPMLTFEDIPIEHSTLHTTTHNTTPCNTMCYFEPYLHSFRSFWHDKPKYHYSMHY